MYIGGLLNGIGSQGGLSASLGLPNGQNGAGLSASVGTPFGQLSFGLGGNLGSYNFPNLHETIGFDCICSKIYVQLPLPEIVAYCCVFNSNQDLFVIPLLWLFCQSVCHLNDYPGNELTDFDSSNFS